MPAESSSPAARVRAGGTVLSLCAGPLTVPILRAHTDGPLRFPELRERIGGAAQTTLRSQVGNLRQLGALVKRERGGMPYTVENELTDVGRAVLQVADALVAWLERAPQGPISLGSEPAKAAIRALVGAWGSTMLRALAARPLSLTALDSLIPDLSYPGIERRLAAMRAARQVEQAPGQGGGRPYAVTPWLRQAVAPLAVAGRCECRHLADEAEVLTRIDIEAAFLLSVPLVRLPEGQGGECLLAVDTSGGELGPAESEQAHPRLAGVRVAVEDGRVVSCVSRLENDPGTWVLGTVQAWLDAFIDGRLAGLRIGGDDPRLVRSLAAELHSSLYTHIDAPK
ncbi:MAG TPA: winged helix-turn-helix transcriptional regulator [Solirubrobacterales bacterium]|nr:winged helix-turn-helix transcriptional regulator [Solirubrobacterales bacterium]